jgi:hypothetical protein
MLTTLDTSRLVPRTPASAEPHHPADADQITQDSPAFTVAGLVTLLEDRPDLREAIRNSILKSPIILQENTNE